MTEGTKEQGRGVGGTSTRAAAWLAWSLVALSLALLLGGIALSRAGSTVPDLPFGGETDDGSVVANLVTLLPFSVVGAIIASRQPRNTIGWLFCSVGVTIGLNSFAGDYAEFWLASGFGTREPRRDGGVAQFVVVDPPSLYPHELPAAVVPRWSPTLTSLAACGLGRRAWDRRRRGGLRAEGRSARRLPTHREPLRRRWPRCGGGGSRR